MIPWFDPVIVDLGRVRIHSFGLLVLMALTLGPFLGALVAWASKGRGWPLIGLPVGAVLVAWPIGRAVEVLRYNPELLFSAPELATRLTMGTSFPGFVAGMVPVAVFVGLAGRTWGTIDGVAVALATGSGLIEFARFLVHDHPGRETLLPIGVRGICLGQWRNPHYACHDLGLYAFFGFSLFLILALALVVARQRGWTAGLFAIWAGTQHVLLEVLFGGGLSTQLWPALPLIGFGLVLLVLRILIYGAPPGLDDDALVDA